MYLNVSVTYIKELSNIPTVSRAKAKAENGRGRGDYSPEQWPSNHFTQVSPKNIFLNLCNHANILKNDLNFYFM